MSEDAAMKQAELPLCLRVFKILLWRIILVGSENLSWAFQCFVESPQTTPQPPLGWDLIIQKSTDSLM